MVYLKRREGSKRDFELNREGTPTSSLREKPPPGKSGDSTEAGEK